MMFWIFAALLAGISVLGFLWPILRKSGTIAARGAGAIAIFKDQLAEVERDVARGVISDEDAQAARLEIKRRILSADRDISAAPGAASKQTGRGIVILLACLMPVAAAGIYTVIGAPGVPSLPFAARIEEQQNATELLALTQELETRLNADEAGGETRGWELLAATFMNMGRYDQARAAWERIVERPDATSATLSQYAETLIGAENGIVTPAAERAIARALELDPLNPAGTYYQAIALDQQGQTLDARQLLLARISKESQSQGWMGAFIDLANRMGMEFGIDPVALPEFAEPPRGPSADDVEQAAQMSEEERLEFIQGMVGNLAQRLEDDPGNLEGWLRLAQAYAVLGQREDAIDALQQAAPLVEDLPQDDPRRLSVEGGLQELQR